MKRIALLLAIMAVAVVATARVSFDQRPIQQQNNRVASPSEKIHGPAKNMTRFDASLRIPDGDLKTYKRSGQYVYVKNGFLYRGFQTDKVDIVYADNNVVYLKNILCGAKNYFGDNFWVQGTINDAGTEITVPMGQSLYTNELEGTVVILGWGVTTDVGDDVSYRLDENVTEVVYAINGDKISCIGTSGMTTSDSFAATGLSAYWSDDDSWTGFIECNTVLTETAPVAAPEVISEIPEGCQVVTYAYKGECVFGQFSEGWSACPTRGKIDVAFADDGVVYLRNPMWWHNSYNTWVRGTYNSETGDISVPTGQYLAWSDKSGYGIQLKWGSTYIVENGIDENGNPIYELRYSVDESIREIMFNIHGNYISLLGCDGNINNAYPYNYATSSMMAVYSDNQSLDALELNIYGTAIREVIDGEVCPETPWIEYFEYYGPGDYSVLYFSLSFSGYLYDPSTGVYEYVALDPEYLSYSVYNQGERIIFDADAYNLPYDMDEIPYSEWSKGYPFSEYSIYFIPGMFDYDYYYGIILGLQVHYTVNGHKNSSDVYYFGFNPTSTNEVPAEKSVSGVRYYNVMGQEIPAPEGLTIKVTTYTDGTKKTTKLVK